MNILRLFVKPAPKCSCGVGGICRHDPECTDIYCEGNPRQSEPIATPEDVSLWAILLALVVVSCVVGSLVWFVYTVAPIFMVAVR